MRFSLALLASAGLTSAISFGDWLQTNGLVAEYANFIRFTDVIDRVEAQQSVTVFIPTDDAWKRWQAEPGVSNNSFTFNEDTFLYMTINKAMTLKELETPQTLTSLLQGEKLKTTTSGIYPSLTAYILSGDNFKSNATVGVIDFDFNIANGHVQLVNNVFKLPSAIAKKAQANPTQSAASTSFGSVSLLACAGVVGLMALL